MDYICRLIWSIYLILYYYSLNLFNYFLYICYLLVLCFRHRQSEIFLSLKFFTQENWPCLISSQCFFHIETTYLICMTNYPANVYLFKANSRNTIKRCDTCSKLTSFGVFIVNFEHISHLSLVFLLLTLSKQMLAG